MSSPMNYTVLGTVGNGDNYKPREVERRKDGTLMKVFTLFVDDYFGREYKDSDGITRKERKQIQVIFDEPAVANAWKYIRPGRRLFLSGRHYCNPRTSTYFNRDTGVTEMRTFSNETLHPYVCRFVDISLEAMSRTMYDPLVEAGMITEEQRDTFFAYIEKVNGRDVEDKAEETSEEEPKQKDLNEDGGEDPDGPPF